VSGKNRKRWMTALRVGLSAAAVLVLFQVVRLEDVVRALRVVAPMGLVLAALLNFATRGAAAGRTYSISRAGNLPVSFSQTVQALFVANFWGLAMPGVSAGSISTVYRYHGRGAGIMQSVAVLAASRVVELLAFCLLGLIGIAVSTRTALGPHRLITVALVGIIALGILGLVLMQRLPRRAQISGSGALMSAGGFLGRAREAVLAGVVVLRNLPPRALLEASGWAMLQGALDAATVLVLALALGIGIDLPQALWINALTYAAVLLPISAAGLGMREVAVLAALLPLGVDRVSALALAMLMLAMTLLNALAGAAVQMCTPGKGEVARSG
jgi:glycosyltransferase 2 family protein